MSENGLMVRESAALDFDTVQRMSKAFVASGFFKDTRDIAQAVVKIQAGQELGLPPFASMTGINIIQGKAVLGANVIATLIANDPRYSYRVKVATDTECVIDFFELGQHVGSTGFTMKEAGQAGLAGKDNWKKYPSDMLFARTISRGARRFAPGIFGGAPVYTPDELGADVDEDGYVVVEQGGIDWDSVPEQVLPAEIPNAGNFDDEPPKQQPRKQRVSKPAPGPVDWREKIASNRRPTVATIASALVAAGHRDNEPHAVASILKRFPDFDGAGSQMSTADGLAVWDRIVGGDEEE